MYWHTRAQRRRRAMIAGAGLGLALAALVFTPKMDGLDGWNATGFGPLISSAQADDAVVGP